VQKGHSNNTSSARSSGAEDMAAVDSDESDFGDDMALVPSMKAHTGGHGLGAASAPAAAVPLKKCSAPPTCGRCFAAARGAHAYCAAVRPHHCCRDGQVCAGNHSAAHPRTHGRGLWRHESRRCATGAQSRHQALCRFLECPPSGSWRRTQQVEPSLWEHGVWL